MRLLRCPWMWSLDFFIYILFICLFSSQESPFSSFLQQTWNMSYNQQIKQYSISTKSIVGAVSWLNNKVLQCDFYVHLNTLHIVLILSGQPSEICRFGSVNLGWMDSDSSIVRCRKELWTTRGCIGRVTDRQEMFCRTQRNKVSHLEHTQWPCSQLPQMPP